ncbi:prolyl oligopeptidase family serine peptidase [Gryllotalpicola ginsengisoli]|uniref:prolyl oligopeptidase family serine peptidase n=1 Tax=Gryllotalpicola ginsengisoli TaxID=444608 RepID=UPI0003B3E30B|nr:prolyl oligopeptidase family serine peptidase [Gryllotalpicola ginsengisoli]
MTDDLDKLDPAASGESPLTYPHSPRGEVVEVLHGREIADPYRWLEDPDSEQTRDWVQRQNAFTESVFADIPEREYFHELMGRVVRRPRAGIPVKRGGTYFVTRNDGSRNQDQVFVADTLAELRAGGRLVLDPNAWSADGTTSLRGFTVSPDGRYLTYNVSEGGSDWVDLTTIDLATGEQVEAPIQTKFGSAQWLPDGRSFLYEAVPHEGRAVGSQAGHVTTGLLKLHRLGTPEAADETVVDIRDEYRQAFVWAEVSSDGGLAYVALGSGTERENRLWLFRITTGTDGSSRFSAPIRVFDTPDAFYHVVRADGDRVVVHTDLGADLGRVVAFDLGEFERTGALELEELVPEASDSLQSVHGAGDELLAVRLVDAQPRITRHALDGRELGTVEVPGGAIAALWSEQDSDEWFLGLSTPTSPGRAFRAEVGSGALEPLDDLVPPASGEAVDFPEVAVGRARAVSADGTPVPYFLIRPDTAVPAPAPVLLWGYGGFDIPVEADYRPLFAGWLAAGGVLAIANLRGGGEFGRAWAEAGKRDHKQNVFDDFIAVAEHLVETGETTREQLAVHGRSNGGLLIGAVLTQRPELFAAAIPGVGVLDILRFHKFTAGAAWTSDYGDPDDPHDFEVGLAYSPLHNVRPLAYPPTLVLTADHDDRVVPAHSHKFTATLQTAQQGPAPVVTRIETQAGHGAGKPLAMVAAEAADVLAFAAHFTGLRVPSVGSAPQVVAP